MNVFIRKQDTDDNDGRVQIKDGFRNRKREGRSSEIMPFYFLYLVLILSLSYVRPRRWPNFHGSGQLVATVELLRE